MGVGGAGVVFYMWRIFTSPAVSTVIIDNGASRFKTVFPVVKGSTAWGGTQKIPWPVGIAGRQHRGPRTACTHLLAEVDPVKRQHTGNHRVKNEFVEGAQFIGRERGHRVQK